MLLYFINKSNKPINNHQSYIHIIFNILLLLIVYPFYYIISIKQYRIANYEKYTCSFIIIFIPISITI